MTISIITLGHVDHGKSTVMARFLYKNGNVPENVIKQIEKESKLTREDKKFPWSNILDILTEEQISGKTSDISFYPFTFK